MLLDPTYDGEVFHTHITDTPTLRDELVCGEYTWEAEEFGEGQVAVKIVYVLGEEWFGVIAPTLCNVGEKGMCPFRLMYHDSITN